MILLRITPSFEPICGAAQQHLFRAYYQVQAWLANELNPEQWGWVMNNNFLEPITTMLPPAPDSLLNMIFCNCTKGCGPNCGCRKVGLPCSVVCGHCQCQSCLNATHNADSGDTSDDIDIEEAEYNKMNHTDYLTPDMSGESDTESDIEGDIEEEEQPAIEEDEDEEV